MFVKLFSTILDSSIWSEDLATRMVWITMLAMADQHGRVYAAMPGLAHRANISVEDCRHAIAKFEAPDPDTRDGTDGRRVERLDGSVGLGGGWQLLNYKRYRELRSRKQIMDAERIAEKRKRKRDMSVTSTVTEATKRQVAMSPPEAEAEAEAKSNKDMSGNLPVPVKETAHWIADALHEISPTHFVEERYLWEGRALFAFWQWRARKNDKTVIFTDDRKARARRWLKIYGLPACLFAVEGAFHHPDMQQDSGKTYTEFENIFLARDGAGRVEKLRDAGEKHPQAVTTVLDRLVVQGWVPDV